MHQRLLREPAFQMPAAPGPVAFCVLHKFLRGEIALAEQQKGGAGEGPPGLCHALLKTGGIGWRWAASHGAQTAAE